MLAMQPPKKSVANDPLDMPISLRMKYGIHTFFLLLDPLATFSDLHTELLFALRDSNTQSLRTNADDPEPTPLPPPDEHIDIPFGVLKDPHDETKGWKDLKAQGDQTLVSKGLKNNTMVAFVIRDANEADQTPDFVVQWPQYDEDEDDQLDDVDMSSAEAADADEEDDDEL